MKCPMYRNDVQAVIECHLLWQKVDMVKQCSISDNLACIAYYQGIGIPLSIRSSRTVSLCYNCRMQTFPGKRNVKHRVE